MKSDGLTERLRMLTVECGDLEALLEKAHLYTNVLTVLDKTSKKDRV